MDILKYHAEKDEHFKLLMEYGDRMNKRDKVKQQTTIPIGGDNQPSHLQVNCSIQCPLQHDKFSSSSLSTLASSVSATSSASAHFSHHGSSVSLFPSSKQTVTTTSTLATLNESNESEIISRESSICYKEPLSNPWSMLQLDITHKQNMVHKLGIAIEKMMIISIKAATSFTPQSKFDKMFTGNKNSTYSIARYVERIVKYFDLWCDRFMASSTNKNEKKSENRESTGLLSLMGGLIYLDRLSQTVPKVTINQITIHRLLITAIYISYKFFEDHPISSSYVARVGGISVEELHLLEIEFTKAVKFDLYISEKELSGICERFLSLARAIP